VPKTYALCTDDAVIGSMFYVMGHLDGRSLWDGALPASNPTERAGIYDSMNRVIAALHSVDYAKVGLTDFGKQGEYLQRQIGRWSKQYKASETREIPAFDRLIEWLPANIPPGDETTIVHGDYRLDNTIIHKTESHVIGVLDWELSTLGHPLADLAYHVMVWRLPGGEFRGLLGQDLKALGIPTEQEYLDAYCRRTGRDGIDPKAWDFYIAYNMFRIGAIRQGIMKRVVDGTAANERAAIAGGLAGTMADYAWEQVEKIKAGR
jgi:aminoglycoside phosphotransferase (APT) family kinase protein